MLWRILHSAPMGEFRGKTQLDQGTRPG